MADCLQLCCGEKKKATIMNKLTNKQTSIKELRNMDYRSNFTDVQGQGRIEKTEIIEMAIKHITTLQAQVEDHQSQLYSNKNPGEWAARICTEPAIGGHIVAQA
jgi:hypothetical protein